MRVLIVLFLAAATYASVISDVRSKLSAGDLSSAEAVAEEYHRTTEFSSEYAAAVSWLARGALNLGRREQALLHLEETKRLIALLLKTKNVDDDNFLQTAVGASIEVEAQLLAASGQRDQAVALLESQLPRWKTWWIQGRIQKNLNLLTLEGQRAPELDASYRGKPVLLFLWAHWCGDCKAEAPVIARLKKQYEPRGLIVVAPTRRYGDVPKIEKPTAEQEDQEIERVWNSTYAELGGTPHPISDAMMLRYGVTSTPTLVLIDRKGFVRMYRPTRLTETELARRIEGLLQTP